MAMVKVWNDNVHPYTEKFKDQDIKIPPKSFIMMEAGEAVDFRGTFAPIKVDADGNPIAEGFKMIRIEEVKGDEDGEAADQVNPRTICQACKYEASSEKDLNEHAKAMHADALFSDPLAEEAMKKAKKARKAS